MSSEKTDHPKPPRWLFWVVLLCLVVAAVGALIVVSANNVSEMHSQTSYALDTSNFDRERANDLWIGVPLLVVGLLGFVVLFFGACIKYPNIDYDAPGRS